MAKRNNQKEYIVEGTITDPFDNPLKGLLVKATDQDPNTPENLLGTPVYTNDKGHYKITYNDADFRIRGRESGGADIIIRVFSPEGEMVGKSKRLNNSPQHTTIDMEVDYTPVPEIEWEWMVSGKIHLHDGQPARQFYVQAFDKDLRSEQLLGEGMTSKTGDYSIPYSSLAIIRAERGSADLFVRVFDPRNRLVGTSDVLFNAISRATIDFQIDAEEYQALSEFESIWLAVFPLLSDTPLTKLEESEKHQDISFLSGETGYSFEKILHFVQAHYYEKESPVNAPFWYVVLGMPFYDMNPFNNLKERRHHINERLGQLNETGIRKAVRIAIATHKIKTESEKTVDKWLQQFSEYVAESRVTAPDTFIRKALETAGIKTRAKQTKFAKIFNKFNSFSPDLIEELKKNKFKVAEIGDLQTTYELSGFVNGDFEMVKSIKETFKITEPKDIRLLAKKSEQEWIALAKKSSKSQPINLPIDLEIPKVHKLSFTEVYGKTLHNQFRSAFPTMAFSGGLERAIEAENKSGFKNPDQIKKVIEANPDFELLTTPIDEFARKNTILKKDTDLKLELKAVQRVFKLNPDFEATNTLMKDNLHSAHGIYRMGESEFIRNYENKPGFTKEKARATWRKAEATHAATVSLVAELKATENAGSIAALKVGNGAVSGFPNWNNLFKGGDVCECKHCRSVYSPAAYFADLLMFLKDRKPKGIPVTNTLFDRRPDLGQLELNCENANITLPYIDVVNEVLEAVVAEGGHDKELTGFTTIDGTDLDQARTDVLAALQAQDLSIGANIHLTQIGGTDQWVIHSDDITYLLKKKGGANYFTKILRNTKAVAGELRANPQYVNPIAYQKLRKAKFPFALPFDLFGEEVKASFDKVKIKRWELMQLFRGTAAPNNATEGDVAAVYFGISVDAGVPVDEKTIILQAAPVSQFEMWGESSNATLLNNIKNVKTFLRVTGLEYNQLLTLLDLEFINPGKTIRIDHLDPTCDTDQKEIKPFDVNTLDRINRFLRLWRKLSWEMWEVDLVIRHSNIGNTSLNEPFLINLMYLVELKNKLGRKVTIEQVCTLLGDLNTHSRFKELHEKRADAIYQELFLNKKLIYPLDEVFEVSNVDAATNAEKLASHKSSIQAALRVKETDLDIYLNLTKASDGNLYISNGVNGDLILTNLSFVYRHAFLAKSLKVKAADWETWLKIHNTDIAVFSDPKSACEFVEDIQLIQSSEFKMDDLNYLLRADLSAKAFIKEAVAGRFLLTLRNSLQAITAEFDPTQYEFLKDSPPNETDKLEELLTTLLQRLGHNDERINYIQDVLENTATTETKVQGLPVNFDFPPSISNVIKIRYNDTSKMIRFTGLMTDAERNTLLNDASLAAVTGSPAYQEVIQELYQQPRLAFKFFEPIFQAPLSSLPQAIDFRSQLSPELASKISYNASELRLQFAGIMTKIEKEALDGLSVDATYLNAVNSLYTQPTIGVFDTNKLWIVPADLDYTGANFYEAHLVLAIIKLLDHLKERETASIIVQQLSAQLDIAQNIIIKLINNYQIIGTETLFEHYKSTFGTSSGVLDYATAKNSFDTLYWLHRFSLIFTKWDLNFDELEWLMNYHGSTKTMDFATLPVDNTDTIASLENFLRTEKLLKLNNLFRNDEISLLSIIGKLKDGHYTTITDFVNELEVLTGWNTADVEEWINEMDLAYPADFILAENWIRLYESIKIMKQLNSGTLTVLNYAASTMGQPESQILKQLLRSKYGPETWLSISTEIQDVLRERKRDALSGYILAQPQPAGAPSGKWEHTNDLYAYYLLDTEMSSCMLTSRLVQGSGSIQLFVQRSFMGLEPEVPVKSDGDDGDSAWRWWKWMRKYRVWEANRKVFLYPENWIEPELRRDKSGFFQDLENELLQNEVNQLNVEQAYLNYLDKVNEVARLDVAGFYHEDDADQAIIHVFGRTANADPHIYYYRQYDYRRWTPWEKVEVDIVGDHLIPMVVNKRLYIFWPEFREEPDDDMNNNVDIPDQGENNSSLPSTYKRTQLKLGGSELRNGKWTPKKISKDFFESNYYTGNFDDKSIRFYPVDQSEIDGRIGIKFTGSMYGSFELFGCEGVPVKSNLPGNFTHTVRPDQSTIHYLDYIENSNRTDSPEDDFSLWSSGNLLSGVFKDYLKNPIDLLEKTPDLFNSYFAWHLSWFDKLYQGLPAYMQNVKERGLSVGSWLPFFYADRRKTFVAFPMLGCSNRSEQVNLNAASTTSDPKIDCASVMKFANAFLNGDENSKYYYPEIKAGFKEIQSTIEGYLQTSMEGVDLSGLTQAQKVAIANQYGSFMGEDPVTSISDVDLIELVIRFFIRIFNFYLGMYSTLLFNFRRYHFKNFYHPFICDFINQVYNPVQGIPAMMSRKTQLKNSDFSFDRRYDPTPWVYDHPVGEEYPKEVVDFSPDGSYSSYNWELFYHTPLMIANSLSQNQRFEEAMEWYHFIFNPIGVEGSLPDGTNAGTPQKYWITKPFFLTTNEDYNKQRIDTILRMIAGDTTADNYSSQMKAELAAQVRDWRYHPFEPHRIAQYRNVAYQKTVFMKYLDNLIAWGDQLFRQDSMESINEATQLYILAAELLGPRPKNIPPQVVPPTETFIELEKGFDDFSNALIQIENYIPVMSEDGKDGSVIAPIPTLYFCIPQNDKILSYWDTVADRLYKIRNCMNIEGVVRQLSLFEPEIDPGALVRAIAGGMDLSSALADLNAPLPYYRFNILLQKANEVCNDVRALGNALLSVLEKKDAEELSLLRQGHELQLLDAIKLVRGLQIEEAKKNLDGLNETKVLTEIRRDYYRDIEKVNTQEKLQTDKLNSAHNYQEATQAGALIASVISLIPDIDLGASGFGGSPVAKFKIGGINLGQAAKLAADVLSMLSLMATNDATMASIKGGQDRRFDDWKLQERIAEQELVQIDEQILSSEVRIKISEKEFANQELQINNSKEVGDFMKSKYTNKDLYQWMIGQISQVYFQSYQLAYDLAKKAERCYRFELGIQESDFIKFGYWDSLKKGLLSGEKLQYDLRRLESSYLEQNRRELELTRHISLALLDPLALIKLKETGKCFFSVPEEIFDLDYPGHFFRRIKSVSISLPCVAGPYTTISCSLRQLNNHIRVQTGVADGYAHNNEDGIWVNDSRFVQTNIPVKAIATSSAQNDSGIFELSFKDERYLPFEGAGVISDWTIDLFNDPDDPDFGKSLRQFDYNTISDAIVHVRYTAREAGGLLKKEAISNLREYFDGDNNTPGLKIINLKHDFPSDWHKLIHPNDPSKGNVMEMKITSNLFPYRDHLHTLKVNSIALIARCSDGGDYDMTFHPPLPAPPPAGADALTLTPVAEFGNLHYATKDTSGDSIELDFSTEMIWTLKVESPSGNNLSDNELDDMYLVLGYEWED